jgi:hypothetical protein
VDHLCPTSWATRVHSVLEAVETPVPETTDPDCWFEVVWHNVPSHATPTSVSCKSVYIRYSARHAQLRRASRDVP